MVLLSFELVLRQALSFLVCIVHQGFGNLAPADTDTCTCSSTMGGPRVDDSAHQVLRSNFLEGNHYQQSSLIPPDVDEDDDSGWINHQALMKLTDSISEAVDASIRGTGIDKRE